VRIFDTRKPLFPLSQIDVGGGVWRVKWHPSLSRKSDLLVACMHDGFKVCRSKGMLDKQSGQQSSWEVVTRYDAHQSLAYGVDWSFDTSGGETLIASCSFYDHAVRLWTA
jgi:diphthamide biosynthesis protein 7